MRLTCGILFGAIGILTATEPASAQTNEEPFEQFGWEIAMPDAGSNAMGGTAVASVEAAATALTNPAALTILSAPQVAVDFRTDTLRVRRLTTVDSLLTGALTPSADSANAVSFLGVVTPLRNGRVALALTRHEFLDYRSAFHMAPRVLPGVAARGPSPVDSLVDVRAVTYGAAIGVALSDRVRVGFTASIDHLRADMSNTRHDVAGGPTAADIREIDVVTNESTIHDA